MAQRVCRMSCLAVDYKLGPSTVIGAVRDGASVNGAALRQLMLFFIKNSLMLCASPTLLTMSAAIFSFNPGPILAHVFPYSSFNARLI